MAKPNKYRVLTIQDVQNEGKRFVQWLEEDKGIDLKNHEQKSRFPNQKELSNAFAKLDLNMESSVQCDFYGRFQWKAYIESVYSKEYVELICNDFTNDDTSPVNFYITHGHIALMRLLLSELAKSCGPLLLLGPETCFLEDGKR